jgi:hypothetical protein
MKKKAMKVMTTMDIECPICEEHLCVEISTENGTWTFDVWEDWDYRLFAYDSDFNYDPDSKEEHACRANWGEKIEEEISEKAHEALMYTGFTGQ